MIFLFFFKGIISNEFIRITFFSKKLYIVIVFRIIILININIIELKRINLIIFKGFLFIDSYNSIIIFIVIKLKIILIRIQIIIKDTIILFL